MEMLTTSQVATLKGCSPQYIRRKAKEGALECTLTKNERGKPEYLIPVTALEPRLQHQFFENKKLAAAKKAAEELTSCKAPAKQLDHYTAEERAEIAFWMRLVEEWQDYRTRPDANKTKVDQEFETLCKLRYPERGISIDTLYRRWKAVRDKDFDGLIDKRGKWKKGKSSIDETLWQAFLSFYLDENQHPIKRCYEYTKTWARSDFPSIEEPASEITKKINRARSARDDFQNSTFVLYSFSYPSIEKKR